LSFWNVNKEGVSNQVGFDRGGQEWGLRAGPDTGGRHDAQLEDIMS